MNGDSVRNGALGCVGHLAAVALLWWMVDGTIAPHVTEAVRPLAAGAASILLTLGLSSFWSLARGYGRGDASAVALLQRASTGEPPREDGPVVATGRARPLRDALRAPISGVECVAYFYRMFYWTGEGTRRQQTVPVYWGYASRPFRVDTTGRALRVMAVPQIGDDAVRRATAADVERARQHVEAVRFDEVGGGPLGALGTALTLAGEVFGDEDGDSRRDWRLAGTERDPATLLLEETALPVGATVTVSGRWSADRQAIVPASGGSGPGVVSVVTGGPERLSRAASALPSSPWSVTTVATLLILAGAGIVWLARTGRLAQLIANGLDALR